MNKTEVRGWRLLLQAQHRATPDRAGNERGEGPAPSVLLVALFAAVAAILCAVIITVLGVSPDGADTIGR